MKRLLFILLLLTFLSCTREELKPEQRYSESLSLSETAPKIVAVPDSSIIFSRIQSDYDYIILSQIQMEDGEISLALSREEAIGLGVPEEIYDKYVNSLSSAQ